MGVDKEQDERGGGWRAVRGGRGGMVGRRCRRPKYYTDDGIVIYS